MQSASDKNYLNEALSKLERDNLRDEICQNEPINQKRNEQFKYVFTLCRHNTDIEEDCKSFDRCLVLLADWRILTQVDHTWHALLSQEAGDAVQVCLFLKSNAAVFC